MWLGCVPASGAYLGAAFATACEGCSCAGQHRHSRRSAKTNTVRFSSCSSGALHSFYKFVPLSCLLQPADGAWRRQLCPTWQHPSRPRQEPRATQTLQLLQQLRCRGCKPSSLLCIVLQLRGGLENSPRCVLEQVWCTRRKLHSSRLESTAERPRKHPAAAGRPEQDIQAKQCGSAR